MLIRFSLLVLSSLFPHTKCLGPCQGWCLALMFVDGLYLLCIFCATRGLLRCSAHQALSGGTVLWKETSIPFTLGKGEQNPWLKLYKKMLNFVSFPTSLTLIFLYLTPLTILGWAGLQLSQNLRILHPSLSSVCGVFSTSSGLLPPPAAVVRGSWCDRFKSFCSSQALLSTARASPCTISQPLILQSLGLGRCSCPQLNTANKPRRDPDIAGNGTWVTWPGHDLRPSQLPGNVMIFPGWSPSCHPAEIEFLKRLKGWEGIHSPSAQPFGNLPLLSWLGTLCLLNYPYSGPICSQLLLCGVFFPLLFKISSIKNMLEKESWSYNLLSLQKV